MDKKTKQIIDLAIVIGIILLAVPIILKFQVKPLISTFFFFVLPSLYLLLRKTERIKRTLAASFLFGIIFGYVFDFLAILNDAWTEPTQQLVFGYKVLGIVPIDHIIWFFFWVMIIIVFYEHFVEHERSDKISHNFKYALFPSFLTLIGTTVVFYIAPNILKFNYAYALLGLLTLLPFLFVVFRKPLLLIKFLKVSAFFIFLFLTFELTALKLGPWYFPGQYIGKIELMGLAFPFEEFFFWILMSSTIVLAYYEEFVDDEK